jgi:ABC-type sulfate/molybdate transport systems ATPase subunit
MSTGAPGLHVDATFARDAFSVRLAFDVPPGRVLALSGPADSGATTIIRTIAGRLPVAAGEIVIDGMVVSAPGATVSREVRRVGAVFDGYRLSSRLTVGDHIANVFRTRGTPLPLARAEARPWLERFELDHLAALRPSDLEPAQRLSLALARALAADPAVLVLDEPLEPLAGADRLAARRSLASLLREFGRPVVIGSRDPDDAATLASDVHTLRG